MARFLYTAIFITLMLQVNCNGPTEPGFKNPREYTWTARSLVYSSDTPSSMYSIWGASASNIYVCGYSLLSGRQGAMFHYDGKGWTNVATLPSPDYNDFSEIIGFGESDIWMAGLRFFIEPGLDSAVVLHYNGRSWNQMLPSHLGVRALRSAWGTSSQNLYFGSRDGKIIHFNGSTWSVDTLHLGLSVTALGGDDENVFAFGTTGNTIMAFKRSKDGAWQLLDQQPEGEHDFDPRFGLYSIYTASRSVYYSSSAGVFRWENNKWEKIFGGLVVLTAINGTGPSNIFAVGRNTRGPAMYHWDGTTWEKINLPEGIVPEDVLLYGIWTDGKEAFSVGNIAGKSYVLHGR